MGRLNLIFKIFDFKLKIPKTQNNIILTLVRKFPKMKLIGKKAKTIFINKEELMLKFSLFKIVLLFNI